ncbi:MAG: YbhB/YbcL family Raf kinase inhibitor-like protein [Acidobacteriota bacterium]
MRLGVSALATILLLGGSPLLAQTRNFSVDFSWSGTGACFDPKSPPFSLSDVPAGTKRLVFSMKDLDAPGFPHGGGNVPYTGESQIARGAFAYKGPCPPQGQHTYQWTVEARDGAGKTLATATVARKFPTQ